jgi:medium-chain acyl-[acyl-carrier-protein] hydrolase
LGKIQTLTHEIAYYECDINQNMTMPELISVAVKVSSDQSDALGIGTDDINKTGITWVIVETHVDITRFPKLGEVVTFSTEATSFNKFFCYRDFWVKDAAGRELVKISMSFVLMDLIKRKITTVSEELMAPFESRITKKIKRWPKIERIAEADEKPYRVRFFDLDSNKHVNNAKYFYWMIDSLDYDFLTKYEVKTVTIKFDKEIEYGHLINSRVEVLPGGEPETRHEIMLGAELCCEANITWREITE